MSSHVLTVIGFLFASPLAKAERIELRSSTLVITPLSPHPTLSLEKGR